MGAGSSTRVRPDVFDDSGIKVDALQKLLSAAGAAWAKPRVDGLFRALDKNGDGTLEESEFLGAIADLATLLRAVLSPSAAAPAAEVSALEAEVAALRMENAALRKELAPTEDTKSTPATATAPAPVPATAPTPTPKPKEGHVSAHEAPPDYSAQLVKGDVIPCDEAGPYCLRRFHSNATRAWRGYYDKATYNASIAATREWCAMQTSWGSVDIHNLPDVQHLFQYGVIAGRGVDMKQLRPLIDRAQQEMWRDYSMAYWRTRVPGTDAAQNLLLLERAYEYSEKAFLEAHPGGKPAQRGVESILDLYTGALKAMSSLWNLTTALRAKSGEEGAEISWGAKKGRRIWAKARTKYGGDLSRVTDCARSSLIFESPETLVAVASLLLDRPEAVGLERAAVVGFKNRFANPTEEAYRDLLFNVVLDGHVCEVQLHLKAMADAKKGGAGHRLFTLCRRVLFAPTVAKDTYTGERDAAGKRHGQGKLVSVSGDMYEGAWVAGKYEGHGTKRYAVGNVYEGQYKAGKREGHGTMRFASGSVYDGEWKAGKQEGRGTERFADGDVRQGEFKADKFSTGIQWNADRKTTLLKVEGEVQGEPSLEEAAERVKQLRLEPP